jgi:hypothetical protein
VREAFAVYWHLNKRQPKGHDLEEVIKELQLNPRRRLWRRLPNKATRTMFSKWIDQINRAPFVKMMELFTAIDLTFDDDQWMVLYAMFRSLHVKYGVDTQPAILRLMVPKKPRLNRMALRVIGCARKMFPERKRHQDVLRTFVANLPKRRTFSDAVAELRKKGKAYYDPKAPHDSGPAPSLVFEPQELQLLKRTLAL